MKKYKLALSKSFIFATILFVVGGVLLSNGIINKIHINNCKTLDSIKFSEISSGDYVCGNIQSLLGKESSFDGKHLLFPFCSTDTWSQEEHYVVCVNKVETKYIYLKVPSEFLEEFKKLISTDLSSNYLLYGKVKRSASSDTTIINLFKGYIKGSDKIIIDKYVIEVVDFNKETEKIVQGICLLFAGFLLFFTYARPKEISMQKNTQVTDGQRRRVSEKGSKRDIGTLELLLAEEACENEGLKNKYKAIKQKMVINLILSLLLMITFVYLRVLIIFICLIYIFVIFIKSIFLIWINGTSKLAVIISNKNSHESLKRLIFESDVRLAKYEDWKNELCGDERQIFLR